MDLQRLTHSVSGTSIRNNPIENWEHILDVTKPYFKKKMVRGDYEQRFDMEKRYVNKTLTKL